MDRVLRNLRFDLSDRKVILVFEEAQHLSIECLEMIRQLQDQPPHSGLLFADTHELEANFTRQALELEQRCSGFHAGQSLPGISYEEAAEIMYSELGFGLSQQKIQKLIAKSKITDLRNGGNHSYVSARRLGFASCKPSPMHEKPEASFDGLRVLDNTPGSSASTNDPF